MTAESVAQALAAAQIPQERVGASRTARLQPETRSLYHWILHRFARDGLVDVAALAAEAEQRDLDLASTLAILAREDLVHVDDGAVAVAYPFSGRPTPHRVRFDGHDAYAMCALDALGIAPMFAAPVVIDSRDPISDEAIHVELTTDGQVLWTPESAVVVAGSCCAAAAFVGCCQVLNFFATPANAEAYLQRADVRGHVISIPDAAEAGRAIFGDVFEERG